MRDYRRSRSTSLDSLGRRRRKSSVRRRRSSVSSSSSSSSSRSPSRSRSRERVHERRRDRGRSASRSRSRSRDRSSARRKDRRRRSYSRSPSRSRSRSRRDDKTRESSSRNVLSSSAANVNGRTASSSLSAHDGDRRVDSTGISTKSSNASAKALDDGSSSLTTNAFSHLSEEEQMRLFMGFDGFDSTKGKFVEDNIKSAATGGSRRETKREYRQYMNRRGGFNRPLDK